MRLKETNGATYFSVETPREFAPRGGKCLRSFPLFLIEKNKLGFLGGHGESCGSGDLIYEGDVSGKTEMINFEFMWCWNFETVFVFWWCNLGILNYALKSSSRVLGEKILRPPTSPKLIEDGTILKSSKPASLLRVSKVLQSSNTGPNVFQNLWHFSGFHRFIKQSSFHMNISKLSSEEHTSKHGKYNRRNITIQQTYVHNYIPTYILR